MNREENIIIINVDENKEKFEADKEKAKAEKYVQEFFQEKREMKEYVDLQENRDNAALKSLFIHYESVARHLEYRTLNDKETIKIIEEAQYVQNCFLEMLTEENEKKKKRKKKSTAIHTERSKN